MQRIELSYRKFEIWSVTIIYVLVLSRIFRTTLSHYVFEVIPFIEAKINFSYFFNYFLPKAANATAIYIAFVLMAFFILPKFNERKTIYTILLITIVMVSLGLIFGISITHLQTYRLNDYSSLQNAYNNLFFKEFYTALLIIVSILIYYVLKEYIIKNLNPSELSKKVSKTLKQATIVGISIWLVGFLLIEFSRSSRELIITWTAMIIAACATYVYTYDTLLPSLVEKVKNHYYLKVFVFSLILLLPISLFFLLVGLAYSSSILDDAFFIFLIVYFPLVVLMIAPLSRAIFDAHQKKDKEIQHLKGELSHSNTHLDQLKAQINPHFLFNTLNSLYGTAITEHADRTSNGIQKLGDMMRFMLHENVKDKILLMRDVEYLNNYITLQKLRIVQSKEIKIDIQIEDYVNDFEISPMLLIPFVENAFKHGISLQQPSYIKITLQTKDDVLFFDVSNSIHLKNSNDPEKLKSGIGLENVKQRLALLYPNQHELTIHQSATDFYVHLIIELK